jgi:hypothetical protein
MLNHAMVMKYVQGEVVSIAILKAAEQEYAEDIVMAAAEQYIAEPAAENKFVYPEHAALQTALENSAEIMDVKEVVLLVAREQLLYAMQADNAKLVCA